MNRLTGALVVVLAGSVVAGCGAVGGSAAPATPTAPTTAVESAPIPPVDLTMDTEKLAYVPPETQTALRCDGNLRDVEDKWWECRRGQHVAYLIDRGDADAVERRVRARPEFAAATSRLYRVQGGFLYVPAGGFDDLPQARIPGLTRLV